MEDRVHEYLKKIDIEDVFEISVRYAVLSDEYIRYAIEHWAGNRGLERAYAYIENLVDWFPLVSPGASPASSKIPDLSELEDDVLDFLQTELNMAPEDSHAGAQLARLVLQAFEATRGRNFAALVPLAVRYYSFYPKDLDKDLASHSVMAVHAEARGNADSNSEDDDSDDDDEDGENGDDAPQLVAPSSSMDIEPDAPAADNDGWHTVPARGRRR